MFKYFAALVLILLLLFLLQRGCDGLGDRFWEWRKERKEDWQEWREERQENRKNDHGTDGDSDSENVLTFGIVGLAAFGVAAWFFVMEWIVK